MQSNYGEYAAEQGRKWQSALAQNFGQQLRDQRVSKDLSALKLSELTKEAGFHITRSTIAKIESNSRKGKIDVSELLVLAAVLDVPPGVLLFPGYPARTVAVLPELLGHDVRYSSFYAVEWLAGRARTPSTPIATSGGHEWGRGADRWERMVSLIEERERLAESSPSTWHGPLAEVIQAGMGQVSPEVRALAQRFLEEQQQANDRVERLNQQIEELGGVVSGVGDGEG